MAKTFGFRLRHQTLEEPQINLTALIDVVFVMLIMFILIAPLLDLDRVELAQAPAPSSPSQSLSAQDPSPLTVHVQKDNTVWVNKELTPLSQLPAKLKRAKIAFPKARPQLFHDRKAEFGTYQSVKNAFEEAGFSELDVVLKPS